MSRQVNLDGTWPASETVIEDNRPAWLRELQDRRLDGPPVVPPLNGVGQWSSSPLEQHLTGKGGALDHQVGGDHYQKLGKYQPWEVLKRWLTPEEFRGYMKGTAIAYLARERDKGGAQDIRKAEHTLQALIEMGDFDAT
jgi:hypothetical protein